MTVRRAYGLMVIAAVLYLTAVILAMHVLEPQFSPIKAPMSAYVLGPYGSWMVTSYFALCVALLCVAYAATTVVPLTRQTRTALAAFVIAGAGALLAGIFPMDFPGPPRTLSGRMHALGGALCFPVWTLGAFLLSLGARRDQHWSGVARALMALSAGSIAAFVVLVVSVGVLGFGGYAQRLLVAVLYAWMLIVGLQLARAPHRAAV